MNLSFLSSYYFFLSLIPLSSASLLALSSARDCCCVYLGKELEAELFCCTACLVYCRRPAYGHRQRGPATP